MSSPVASFFPIVNNPSPVIVGVVVVVLFMIILTSSIIVVTFSVWRKKYNKKLRIAALTSSRENKVLVEEEPALPAEDDSKISLGVIQLLEMEKGSHCGVLMPELIELFDSLNNKPFCLY